eukprot:gene18013-biopygen7286
MHCQGPYPPRRSPGLPHPWTAGARPLTAPRLPASRVSPRRRPPRPCRPPRAPPTPQLARPCRSGGSAGPRRGLRRTVASLQNRRQSGLRGVPPRLVPRLADRKPALDAALKCPSMVSRHGRLRRWLCLGPVRGSREARPSLSGLELVDRFWRLATVFPAAGAAEVGHAERAPAAPRRRPAGGPAPAPQPAACAGKVRLGRRPGRSGINFIAAPAHWTSWRRAERLQGLPPLGMVHPSLPEHSGSVSELPTRLSIKLIERGPNRLAPIILE